MTGIERQILLNEMAIIETLLLRAPGGPDSPRELLQKRYRETAQLVRDQSKPEKG